MKLEVTASPQAAAARGAALIAAEVGTAVAARGGACIAVSGGHTPWAMLRALARLDVPWAQTTVFQVDERDCDANDNDRNIKYLKECLPKKAQIVAMPVEDGDAGADAYARRLAEAAGAPAVLDLVHLGLGPDGHTASLVPGDSVLAVRDRDVAWTAPYQGHRRMTLTYPALDRARLCMWLVTGREKRAALARLLGGDRSIPAARVATARRIVIADAAAAEPGADA